MLKICEGCFTNDECIIQEAIINNKFKGKCPCVECLVKMICDDTKDICDEVKLITTHIRGIIKNWDYQ